MRFATLRPDTSATKAEAKDGQPVIVSKDGLSCLKIPRAEFPSLLSVVESWDDALPLLSKLDAELAAGGGEKLDPSRLAAPFPRTFGFLDGSAFIQHVILVRRARNAEIPEDLYTVPLMYQGLSDHFLGPNDDLPLRDPAHGMDFEGEVAVVLGDVPMGTPAESALCYVRLIVLLNDVSLRNLIPREVGTGFGFIHGKPASSYAPFAVTPDECGAAWRDGRLHSDLRVRWNGETFGSPNGGEMHFSFADLIAHAARTRDLKAGTILGSGTFSSADTSKGQTCIAERRMLEKIETGEMKTPFMQPDDTVELEIIEGSRSLFGKISQRVVKVP